MRYQSHPHPALLVPNQDSLRKMHSSRIDREQTSKLSGRRAFSNVASHLTVDVVVVSRAAGAVDVSHDLGLRRGFEFGCRSRRFIEQPEGIRGAV